MTKKEIFIGFTVGIIANIIGIILYLIIFSELSVQESLIAARKQDHLGSLLALGALLNLAAFFGFIKIKREQRAKGVLIATFVTAFIILIMKIL